MPAHERTHPSVPSVSPVRAASRAAARVGDSSSQAPGGGDRSGGDHLSVDGVSASFGERRVLSGISFTARDGDRIGLIGENGTGKSTLLRILAGVAAPDAGEVRMPGSAGLLAQELPYPDSAPFGRVLDDAQRGALAALRGIERTAAALASAPDDPETARAYESALEEAERSGAWSAAARRGETITGLGLGGIAESRPVGELSGGQRLRLALAALLLEAPRILLLDEPSNHLDDVAAAYLERVLAAWPGIVVVASHDRTLLDAIATRILDLDPLPLAAAELADAATGAMPPPPGGDPGSLASSGVQPTAAGSTDAGSTNTGSTDAGPDAESTDDTGSGLGVRVWGLGYSAARAARREELERWRRRYEAEVEERKALLHEIEVGSREVNRKHESKSEVRMARKFYADRDARVTARRARNARVRLEQLERERVRRPPEPLRFAGIPAVSSAGAVSSAEAVSRQPALVARAVRVEGRLAETSLEVDAGGRLLLAGPNGAGKSTLLTVLAGRLAPDSGTVERGCAIGFLPQEVAYERPERSARQSYLDAVGEEVAERRPLSSLGLLAPRDLDRPVASLSVGQRRRVALAALLADPPPLLLLDEPSNHLSLSLVEELEEALHDYTSALGGALVIATHDRWLRSRWEGSRLELAPPGP